MQIQIDKNGKIQLPNFIVKMLRNNECECIKDYIELDVNPNDGTVILSKTEHLKIKYNEIYIIKKCFPHIFEDMLYQYAFSKSFVIDYLERLDFTDIKTKKGENDE